MPKVLVSDPVSEKGLAALYNAPFIQVDLKTKLTEDELCEIIGEYDALVVRSETKVTRRIMEHASRMKIIGRAGVGVDNIDTVAATECGIIVVNAPEGNTIAATEQTMALMYALARHLPQAVQSLKSGEWARSKFVGIELRHKTLGIIGLGKIGTEVAKRARAMEMNILAYDPYVSAERAKTLGVEMVNINYIYTNSDFITVHMPMTKETRNLISTQQFAMMKDGVRIINCARGGIVDEVALYEALKTGKVGGAALDVFEKEPTTSSPLFELENVVVTPHLGASTKEAQINVAIDVAEEILRCLRGEPVQNAVNIPAVKAEVFEVMGPYLDLAEKLGKFAGQMIVGQMEKVEIKYNGKFTEYDTRPITTTLLKGLLKPILQDSVNYVNAAVVAKSRGIEVVESKSAEAEDYTNLLTVVIKSDKSQIAVAGTLFRKNQPRIVKVDDFTVDAVPEGHMLVVPHRDRPRIIGQVGTLIGEHDINIAGMQLGRKDIGGEAIMLLAVDAPVPQDTVNQIAKLEGVNDVRYVSL